MVQGRGTNWIVVMDMLRQIVAKLEAMKTTQRRVSHLDVSDDEAIVPNPNLEPKEDQDEKRLL